MTVEEPRLPTHLWVEAEIRRLSAAGIGVYVTARGDRMGGMVLQKILGMNGQCLLLARERDAAGKLVWVDVLSTGGPAEEGEADAYITRARKRDPDLWVVEVEDKTLTARLSDA